MRFGSIIIMLVLFSMMFIGQTYREEYGENFNVSNITEQLQWEDISYELKTDFDEGDKVQKGLYKFMDAIGYSFTEISKSSVHYGFNHPEYDFGFFLDALVMFVWFIVIMMLISKLPYIIAILYVLWLGLWKLFRLIFETYRGYKE